MTDVKPLDLSNLLKHAFLSGILAARNIPADQLLIDGPTLWLDYDPTPNPAFTRITSALFKDYY